jgi:uncharacterized damage-inducible protein DinB
VLVETIRAMLLRELRALRRQVDAYPTDQQLWVVPVGVPNSAGTLVLHLAGNLQHFIGAHLGKTGYVRQRDLEFSRRDVPRTELHAEIAAAERAIIAGLARVTDDTIDAAFFPEPLAGASVPTSEFLVHLAVHLGYHLGQVDYHRRIVTGDGRSLDALAVKELPSVVRAAQVA